MGNLYNKFLIFYENPNIIFQMLFLILNTIFYKIIIENIFFYDFKIFLNKLKFSNHFSMIF